MTLLIVIIYCLYELTHPIYILQTYEKIYYIDLLWVFNAFTKHSNHSRYFIMFPHDCHDRIQPVHGADFSSELERNLMPDSFICLTTNHPSGRRTFTATRGVDSSSVFFRAFWRFGHLEESLLIVINFWIKCTALPLSMLLRSQTRDFASLQFHNSQVFTKKREGSAGGEFNDCWAKCVSG